MRSVMSCGQGVVSFLVYLLLFGCPSGYAQQEEAIPPEVQTRQRTAAELLKAGNLAGALAEYDQIIRMYPDTMFAMNGQSQIVGLYLQANQPIEAQAALETLWQNHAHRPEFVRRVHELGWEFVKAADYATALRIYTLLQQQHPDHERAVWFQRSVVQTWLEQGDIENVSHAIAQLKAAYASHPDYIRQMEQTAVRLRGKKLFAMAGEIYDYLIGYYPDCPEAALLKRMQIQNCLDMGQYQKARLETDRLLSEFSGQPEFVRQTHELGWEFMTEPELLESIKIRDQIVKADIYKAATFNVLTQAVASDPEQGFLVKQCHVVWKKNETNIKVVYDYFDDPVYSPPDSGIYQPIDYDANKRLIVWRFVERYIISTSEKTEILVKTQLLYVFPNGDIEKSGGYHTTKHIFPAGGKYEGNYEFEQFLLASGLSFSDYIDPNEAPKIEILEGNVILFNSRGTFGKNSKGTWELTMDPEFDFFVRKAVFTGEGLHNPSFEVSMSEIIKTDVLEYARQSQLTFGRLVVREYVDIDISIGDNLELRQEVNRQMRALLVPGSEIIRFNGEKPSRMTVK